MMTRRLSISLVGIFLLQLAVGFTSRHVKPYWDVLDPPPTPAAAQAAALGDSEFLYRVLVASLQTGGDSGGRVIAIKDYDIDRVIGWLELLERLDARANHHVALAMQYFSLSQRKSDLVPLIRFVQRHVETDPRRKLDWLSHALMMAEVRLKDEALALEIADQMGSYELAEVNPIAYMIAPIMREKRGDLRGALDGMRRAKRLTEGRATPLDVAQMDQFIEDIERRLER